MATARKNTTKASAARRFDVVELGNHKSYVPIRDEFGTMEYELHYAGNAIGFATSAEAARETLNEYAYDLERGLIAPVSAEQLATPSSDEAANVGTDSTEASAIYGPEIDIFNAPKQPISTLADGATVYGQFDTDGSHFTVCAEMHAGWSITADAAGLAGAWHDALGISLDEVTRAKLHALQALVNSGAIEHMLACGAAWEGQGAMPAPQAPTVQMTRDVCDDPHDRRCGTEVGTAFTCGTGATAVEMYFPDHCDGRNVPELVALDDSFTPEAIEQALPNIHALLNDPRVQQRRGDK